MLRATLRARNRGFDQLCASAEARLLCRRPSSEFERLLGYTAEPEIVHRDNMVVYGTEALRGIVLPCGSVCLGRSVWCAKTLRWVWWLMWSRFRCLVGAGRSRRQGQLHRLGCTLRCLPASSGFSSVRPRPPTPPGARSGCVARDEVKSAPSGERHFINAALNSTTTSSGTQ